LTAQSAVITVYFSGENMAANLQTIARRHYSLEEYFALEKVGEARYEYWDGDIVCMSGGSLNHFQLTINILDFFFEKLKGKKCRPLTSDMPILTPKYPPYRYPDAAVVCGDPSHKRIDGIPVLENPTIIVEVLSSTTEHADKNKKRIAYQAIKSLNEYILIAQDGVHVTHYVRQGDFWTIRDYRELDAVIELPTIAETISVTELYAGVKFEA
jgi:Uma2 family endonuclease